MRIRIRETGEVMFLDEFLRTFTSTRFEPPITAELIDELGADPVLEGPQPTLAADQYARYDGVEEIDGQWFTKYVAVDYTAEELAARLEQWRQSASCTPFQGKAALFNAGLLDDVEALIASAGTDTITKLAWANAVEWRRSSAMITSLADALQMDEEQVDTLFREAASITA